MSKKLIAVAAAAALALTGLVAVPANSAAAQLTIVPTNVSGVAAGAQGSVVGLGATSTDAIVSAVPSQDVLRSTSTASRSVIALEIATRSDNAAVTVTSTGAVKLVTAAQLAATTTTTATGTQSLSLTSNDLGKVIFYAYSTSTSAGTITATEAGATPASNTVFFKGSTSAGNAYKVNLTAPAIGGLGSKVEYSATVVDMFGNAIEGLTDLKHQTLGGDASAAVAANHMTWSATKKIYEGSFTNRTTAGPVALLVSLTNSADAITAFGAKTASVFVSVNGQDLQAAITALNAQVAALQAIVDRKVTKKRYNTLARKWNRAFPSQKVWVKP